MPDNKTLTIEEWRSVSVRLACELRDGNGTSVTKAIWTKIQPYCEWEDQ